MRRPLTLTVLALALVLAATCGEEAPEAEPPAVTEEFDLVQLSPPIGPHGEIAWPKDGEVARFRYRVVPRRTGREGEWSVAEADLVRGVVLIPPQSDGRGRLSPLSGSTILGDRLVAPEGFSARRTGWLGGEVLWFRSESRCLPPEGAVFGLDLEKGDGWPSFGGTYTCAVALTRDGGLPTATDGSPAMLANLVGPGRDSNVTWFWFWKEREQPSDGISDSPPVSLPIGAKD
jgi:hypothetical protein